MTDTIPQLASHDEPALDQAFRTLATEVQAETAALTTPEAQENFRLHWLGRKQGRLKLIREGWLKSAPAEARKPLGIRFNQLKQQIEAALQVSTLSVGPVGRIDLLNNPNFPNLEPIDAAKKAQLRQDLRQKR